MDHLFSRITQSNTVEFYHQNQTPSLRLGCHPPLMIKPLTEHRVNSVGDDSYEEGDTS
jgi:hypothetical protein